MNTETSNIIKPMLDVVDGAYARMPGQGKTEFFASLTEKERFAVLIDTLTGQVLNGGFSQWWGNGYGTAETVAQLELYCGFILLQNPDDAATTEVLALLLSFASIFDDGVIVSEVEIADDDACAEMYERMNDLDERFYKVDDAFMQAACAHMLATYR